MRNNTGLWLALSSVLCVAIALGQTNRPGAPRAGILPPEAYLVDRDSRLEQDLRRLKESEAGMGPSHPKLAAVQQRIVELDKELELLRAVPNPFANLEEQGVRPRDIVDQLSEKELRGLAVRLALDVKDLRKRVEALERFNPSR